MSKTSPGVAAWLICVFPIISLRNLWFESWWRLMTTEVSSRESPLTFVDFHSCRVIIYAVMSAATLSLNKFLQDDISVWGFTLQMLHPQIIFLLAKWLNRLEGAQKRSHGRVRALPTTGSAGIWIVRIVINDRRPTTTKVDMSEVTGGIVDHQSR